MRLKKRNVASREGKLNGNNNGNLHLQLHFHRVAIHPLKSHSREENQQQTQPIHWVESENRSRATSVGGKCSHHCTIRGPREGKLTVLLS